jgi:prepilin-type N-terminal cleavage/methylation domain-containing protein/prepilin-type processing-associated H-X9-DG protein
LQPGGFTLVELLVVVTIIGILMGLLLPAVNNAREQARRTQCMNNLKQLGLGCLQHLAHQGFFPSGGWGWGWVGDPDRGFHKDQIGGWLYNSLPYLGQDAIHQLGAGLGLTSTAMASKSTINATMVQTPLLFMNCPTRRRAVLYPHTSGLVYGNVSNVTQEARGDYAICSGDSADQYCDGIAPGEPPNAATPTPEYWLTCGAPNSSGSPCSGCWPAPSQTTGVSFQRSEVKAAQVIDGMSQTILIGEKYLVPDNYYNGSDGSDNENMYVGFDNDLFRVGTNPPIQDTPGYSDQDHFGSAHINTCNFVFCDGSVKSIMYFVDPKVFANLCSRNDQNPIDEKSY